MYTLQPDLLKTPQKQRDSEGGITLTQWLYCFWELLAGSEEKVREGRPSPMREGSSDALTGREPRKGCWSRSLHLQPGTSFLWPIRELKALADEKKGHPQTTVRVMQNCHHIHLVNNTPGGKEKTHTMNLISYFPSTAVNTASIF